MYERSAIVLERYFNKIFGFDKKLNLKTIYKNYKETIEEIQKYQNILEEEDTIINEFDATANEIRKIQLEQKKIYKANLKLEEERNKLFDSLDEEPNAVEKKLIKIEDSINGNNKRLEELRENFVKSLTTFLEKQVQRGKCSRNRRAEEKNHIEIIESSSKDVTEMDSDIVKDIKDYVSSDDTIIKKDIIEIMIGNGKDERVPFNRDVIENAVNIRNEIAKEEAECYIAVYDKMKRLVVEASNDEINLDGYEKALRDASVKLAFLKAQKMYIVSFLDNERMTAINGVKAHKQIMTDACEDFKLDMEQFDNLYKLILKEVSNKATKKAYKELYNKEYLKNIEESEKRFEEEINNMKIKAGAVINSNSWRIEEIKNIYKVFQDEISEKFEKDLSEFKLDNNEDTSDSNDVTDVAEDDIFKSKIDDKDVEYIDEYVDDNIEENEDIDDSKDVYVDKEEYIFVEEDDETVDDENDEGEDIENEEYHEDIENNEDEDNEEDDSVDEQEETTEDEEEEFFEEDDDEYEEEYYEEDDEDNDEDEGKGEEIVSDSSKTEEVDDEESKKVSKGKRYADEKKGKKGLFNKFF